MVTATIYSTRLCPYCIRAKRLLEAKGIPYNNIGVDLKPKLRQEMTQKSGRRTVPQIWLGDHHIGGFDDLYALERSGDLDKLLNESK